MPAARTHLGRLLTLAGCATADKAPESTPTPTSVHSGDYAVKHVPFLYFPDSETDPRSCAADIVPYTQFDEDLSTSGSLPDLSFISPNLCNDMHNCPVGTGDAWLAREVPKILASSAFTDENSLLVITFDEGSHADNRVALVFAGPAAKKGYRPPEAITGPAVGIEPGGAPAPPTRLLQVPR